MNFPPTTTDGKTLPSKFNISHHDQAIIDGLETFLDVYMYNANTAFSS